MSQRIATVTGTFSEPNVPTRDVAGSVVTGEQRHTNIQSGALVPAANFGLGPDNTSMDAKAGIQGDQNGFQEVMDFAARWAAATGGTGLAALHAIRTTIDSILQQTDQTRVYAP
jgi:hypothetical protein